MTKRETVGAPGMSNGSLQRFFSIHNQKYEQCLEPTMTCQGSAIRAHSIQNAGVLDLIAEDGHVITPTVVVSVLSPQVILKRVGRNNAATFTGLCARHDAKLFRAIDTQAFDTTNPEHLFLLAYRSMTRELHAAIAAGTKLQLGYQDRLRRGVEERTSPTVAGALPMVAMMKAFAIYEYRRLYFDPILTSRRFEEIMHDVIEFRDQKAVLAVSSFFALLDDTPDDLNGCAINVFPTSQTTTLAVFSYAAHDAARNRSALHRILDGTGPQQQRDLSRLVLERVENFVLAPSHVAAWSSEQRANVLRGFSINTALAATPHGPELSLF